MLNKSPLNVEVFIAKSKHLLSVFNGRNVSLWLRELEHVPKQKLHSIWCNIYA